MTNKGHHLLRYKRVTPSVTAPSDTNLTDATVYFHLLVTGRAWTFIGKTLSAIINTTATITTNN